VRRTKRKAGENMRKFRRIPETLAMALCISLFLAAWAPVLAQAIPAIKTRFADTFGVTAENKGETMLVEESQAVETEDEVPEEKGTEKVTEESKILSVSAEEMELLARAVYSEARGEPFQGQVAIAAVIVNRVENPDFPNTISDVIFEPWAFTAVHDGQIWLDPDETAYEAVREALAGNDPTEGAIYYYNPVTATNQWIRSREIVTSIGKHIFAV